MTTERDARTRIVLSWLREEAHEDAERVLLQALDEVDTTPQRRRFGTARRSFEMNPALKYALSAAAVLAVAFAGLQLFYPGGSGITGPSPTPTSPPTPVPTTPVWDGPGTLAAGRWAMDVGNPAEGTIRVTFEVPAGWQENVVPDVIWTAGSEARFAFSFIDNLYADPCDPGILRDPPIGPTVDDLAQALTNLPGIDAGVATDVTIDGYAGKLVEIDLPGTADPCGGEGPFLFEVESLSQPASLDKGATSRFWILDVDGQRLVVSAVEDATAPQGISNQLEGIIDSLEIEP